MSENEELVVEQVQSVSEAKGGQELEELRNKTKEYEALLAQIEREKSEEEEAKLVETNKFKELYEKIKGDFDRVKNFEGKYNERVKAEWQELAESIPENFKHFFVADDTIEGVELNLKEFDKLKKAGIFDNKVEEKDNFNSGRKHINGGSDAIKSRIDAIFKSKQ